MFHFSLLGYGHQSRSTAASLWYLVSELAKISCLGIEVEVERVVEDNSIFTITCYLG